MQSRPIRAKETATFRLYIRGFVHFLHLIDDQSFQGLFYFDDLNMSRSNPSDGFESMARNVVMMFWWCASHSLKPIARIDTNTCFNLCIYVCFEISFTTSKVGSFGIISFDYMKYVYIVRFVILSLKKLWYA